VQLEVSADGTRLTGAVLGEIVDAQGKADALTRLAAQYRISRDQARPPKSAAQALQE